MITIHPLMTAEQLAQYLQISYGHVRRLLNAGREDELPPYIQVTPTRRRWSIDTVQKWLSEKEKKNGTAVGQSD